MLFDAWIVAPLCPVVKKPVPHRVIIHGLFMIRQWKTCAARSALRAVSHVPPFKPEDYHAAMQAFKASGISASAPTGMKQPLPAAASRRHIT